jgi:hypothetical protein
VFRDVATGTYILRAAVASASHIKLSIDQITAVPRNAFDDLVRLKA